MRTVLLVFLFLLHLPAVAFDRPPVDGITVPTFGSEDLVVEVSVFPNPFVDQLEITTNSNVTNFRIYNILGTLLKEGQPNSQSILVDTSKFASGIYLLEVQAGTIRKSIKIVKR